MFDPYLELGSADLTMNKLNAAECDNEKHACKLCLLGPQCHYIVQSITTPCCAQTLAHDERINAVKIDQRRSRSPWIGPQLLLWAFERR